MADPIITANDRKRARWLADGASASTIAIALAQARAEGRLEGMEEAARVASLRSAGLHAANNEVRIRAQEAQVVADAIRARARTTKEG